MDVPQVHKTNRNTTFLTTPLARPLTPEVFTSSKIYFRYKTRDGELVAALQVHNLQAGKNDHIWGGQGGGEKSLKNMDNLGPSTRLR